MATTDYNAAAQLDEKIPHTHIALTNLLTKMAKCDKYKNKKPFLGRDKKRDALMAFEVGLAELVAAMRLDGITEDSDDAEVIRATICDLMTVCMEVYPNWGDAYRFAADTFARDFGAGSALIKRVCRL
ncbi:hypothetical protein GCM10017044_21650 [Kordiimonas sediminis]|uniref:Uncharacterized protein n=1 Tax=Kordiimonas sediminis TaxID=1735581 RepID=A0A919E943_9PROT|nr:hypothetical protein [Kordiimonas sediminis]GHF26379.1 hypothetical protein GCM10017044_21650 [Kordiimonas sediminis]